MDDVIRRAKDLLAIPQYSQKAHQDTVRDLLTALAASQERLRIAREALKAEDEYWDASRTLACALPRLAEGAKMAFAAATARRDRARTALAAIDGGTDAG